LSWIPSENYKGKKERNETATFKIEDCEQSPLKVTMLKPENAYQTDTQPQQQQYI